MMQPTIEGGEGGEDGGLGSGGLAMPIAVIITSESNIAHIIYWEMVFIHGQYQVLVFVQ